MKFECYDILEQVLVEATERFAPILQPDELRIKKLQEICRNIDKMLEENDGDEFECEVYEHDASIRMTVQIPDLSVRFEDIYFLGLTRAAKTIMIEVKDPEHIRITFLFKGIWTRKKNRTKPDGGAHCG